MISQEVKDKYPIMMTAKHVSEILGVSYHYAYEVMKRKDFPVFPVGRHKKVNREAFFRWIEEQSHKNSAI
ncbi:helix-turn-helix domain-containing protein [Sutcliffiella horikoshii]|uniref:Helix-turn-helix domain-containing protein n=1 Tax=Sutcliffiella horikoshii TaxID=79883 RepID=A0A5D4T0D9_9BACI|nr:helix-turn-helix domain-containing protein [Sutcliffiella horikoshii]TYS68689.1 helix-turn-helix domain-containing protein [Sutcliffiella horikoshii]